MTRKKFLENGGWLYMRNGDYMQYDNGFFNMNVAGRYHRTYGFDGWSFALAMFRKYRKEARQNGI